MEKEIAVCKECGEEIRGDYVEVDGEYVCQDCFDEYYFYCDDCGEIENRDNGYYIEDEDKFVCENCLENNYYRCDDCGEYVSEENAYTINNGRGDFYHVCSHCFDNNGYYYCDNCGDYFYEENIHFRDDYCYCDNCYEEEEPEIYDYHEFNDWQLFKSEKEENPKYYIGAEIELEPKGYSNVDGVVSAIKNINAVGMHDSSLQSGGVEVVTHPETWEYKLENKDKYIKFFKEIEDINYGDDGGAGLHFHVTRPNDNVISRVIVLLESFKDEIKKLSRRSDYQLSHWAKFLSDNCSDGEKVKYQSTKYLKEKYIKDYHDRYYALNLCNSKTIEFRFFNGVNNIEEFWGALQFIHNLMEIAFDENRELNTINWQDLLSGDELISQAQKQGVLEVNKFAKDTTDIIEKYEIALEKAKKDIKNILKNLAKYINKEMSEFDIKQIKANNVEDINRNVNQFLEKFRYRQQYLNRISDLYETLNKENNRLEMHDIKNYWEYTNIQYPVNTERYKRYDKMIQKAIKSYESEVR